MVLVDYSTIKSFHPPVTSSLQIRSPMGVREDDNDVALPM